MKIRVEPLDLELKTPFRIAHGASTTRRNVLVRLGASCWGEGALPPYYPYDYEEAAAYLNALNAADWPEGDAFFLEDILDRLPDGPAPARAAIDLALHDCWGQQLGEPLYRLWGLDPEGAPASAVTVPLPESHSAFREALRGVTSAPTVKLKLGTGSLEEDEALVQTAREAIEGDLSVDANGAWTVDEAAAIIPRLDRCEVIYVEQPISSRDADDWLHLRNALPADRPPIIADESVQTAADVLALAEAVDGINVKLAKAGGLRGARRLITLSHALDLNVLLGCMIESSVALTAAAHLAPLADFLDLDGHLHLARDPFDGIAVQQGHIHLPDRPGLGVSAKDSFPWRDPTS